jgi:hypothetical protein
MNKALPVLLSCLAFGGFLCGQTITLTKPQAGEILDVGHGYLITWTKSGQMDQKVKIKLRQGNTNILDITDSTPNTGSFGWQMPGDISPGAYTIRVRTLDNAVTGDSGTFTIRSVRQVAIAPKMDRPPLLLKFPKLAISNFEVNPNAEGFVITFGYKNVGSGPLPAASQMPVKPTYRLLIDNREINKGNLFIPETPAPPGWEVKTYHGGTIKYPPGPGMDFSWHVGNTVTVHINENKAGGMESDSESYNLRQLVLRHSYDAVLMTPYLNWTGKILVVDIRLDGVIESDKEFQLFNSASGCQFETVVRFNPYQRQYTITRPMDCLSYRDEYTLELRLVIRRVGTGTADLKDIDQRNNYFTKKYTR